MGGSVRFLRASPKSRDRRSAMPVAMDIVGDDAAIVGGNNQPVLVAEACDRVLIAKRPMFAHRDAGELVILAVPLMRLLLADQLNDGVDRQIGELVEHGLFLGR